MQSGPIFNYFFFFQTHLPSPDHFAYEYVHSNDKTNRTKKERRKKTLN